MTLMITVEMKRSEQIQTQCSSWRKIKWTVKKAGTSNGLVLDMGPKQLGE